MKVFRTFTRRCLKENKSRTLVTIIGIVLSMSLLTAVIEGAYSGIQFLVRGEVAQSGSWQGMFCEVTDSELEQIQNSKKIKNTVCWHTVGWADISSTNEYKPYLLIQSIDEGFEDHVQIHLTAGRMPEKSGEILLPRHLMTNGNVSFDVGDELTLNVGKRMSEGYILNPRMSFDADAGEIIGNASEKKYKVAGYYERFDLDIESYACPGYTAITVGEKGYRTDVFFELKHVRKFIETVNTEFENIADRSVRHNDLLNFYGVSRYIGINSVIKGFAVILVILVSFGSISLIYNSFAISVSERTKMYGILKSVGATKKQIKYSVVYEACVLAGLAVPAGLIIGCVGIGVTLYELRDSFGAFVNTSADVQMKFVLNPWALLLAVAVCFLTTIISALIPAKKAIKVSPVDSIRQSNDVKIKDREVKTSKLTYKLFGFEGMMASKNFKRSKKRYRSVVLSLFMSVVLFISASSFCSYLTDAVNAYASGDAGADIYYYTIGQSYEEVQKTADLLGSVQGVDDTLVMDYSYRFVDVDKNKLTKDYLKTLYISPEDEQSDKVGIGMLMLFIDDASFRKFCAVNKLSADKYFNTSAPCGVFVNTADISYWDEKTEEIKLTTCAIFEKNALPVYGIDKYVLDDDTIQETQIYISDYAETSPELFSSSSSPMVVYPFCQLEAIFGNDAESSDSFKEMHIFMSAENHAAAFDSMKELLTENNIDSYDLTDMAADQESERMIVKVVNVFSYGFIILISLIALVNVFNTISTNIILRRREFAMLKSIGLSEKGFSKMMNYECLIYGIKGLGFGLPVSVLVTYVIYMTAGGIYDKGFYMPIFGVAVAVISVFIVVFSTMLYSKSKIKKDNPIDALKNENI